MKRITAVAMMVLCIPCEMHGNMVWPSLVAEEKINSYPIIALSLVLEYFAIRVLFKTSFRVAAQMTLLANIASGFLGLVLRPFSGLAWELSLGLLINWLFDWGTFNPVTWLFVPVLGGAVNAALELLVIKLVWKEKLSSKNFGWLWCVNTATVAIATLSLMVER